MSTHVLDARRLICPLPVIRTQQKIESLGDGEELLVLATDPGSLHDVPAWCRVHGHQVRSSEQMDDEYHILIKVCKPMESC